MATRTYGGQPLPTRGVTRNTPSLTLATLVRPRGHGVPTLRGSLFTQTPTARLSAFHSATGRPAHEHRTERHKIFSTLQRHRRRAAAIFATLLMTAAHAQVCPFDDGNSTLAVDGLILTRYALGITGAPLVAGTDISAVDAPTVEATINCPSCGMNITGNLP